MFTNDHRQQELAETPKFALHPVNRTYFWTNVNEHITSAIFLRSGESCVRHCGKPEGNSNESRVFFKLILSDGPEIRSRGPRARYVQRTIPISLPFHKSATDSFHTERGGRRVYIIGTRSRAHEQRECVYTLVDKLWVP